MEKISDLDENSTFGKLPKFNLLHNLFPKYQTLIEIVEHLKLKDKLNLNMDDLLDDVALIHSAQFKSLSCSENAKQQAANGTLSRKVLI